MQRARWFGVVSLDDHFYGRAETSLQQLSDALQQPWATASRQLHGRAGGPLRLPSGWRTVRVGVQRQAFL